MAILPIIERELRVALRKKRPVRRRLQVAALAVGGTLLFLWMAAVWGNQQAGHNLHQLLCLAAGYLVVQTPRLTAGIFAQERREQTLGLLFLAWLSGFKSSEAMVVLWVLGSFFLRCFYFIYFEQSARAATPGKRMLGLRVVMRDGSPLSIDAIFARNAMRELELFLPLLFMASQANRVDAAAEPGAPFILRVNGVPGHGTVKIEPLPADHWAAPLAGRGQLTLVQQLPEAAFTSWGQGLAVFAAPSLAHETELPAPPSPPPCSTFCRSAGHPAGPWAGLSALQ